MSERKEKNLKRLFKKEFKEEIRKVAKQQVDEKIEKIYNENTEMKNMVKVIARQRDIVFLIACGLLISNILWFVLWWLS